MLQLDCMFCYNSIFSHSNSQLVNKIETFHTTQTSPGMNTARTKWMNAGKQLEVSTGPRGI